MRPFLLPSPAADKPAPDRILHAWYSAARGAFMLWNTCDVWALGPGAQAVSQHLHHHEHNTMMPYYDTRLAESDYVALAANGLRGMRFLEKSEYDGLADERSSSVSKQFSAVSGSPTIGIPCRHPLSAEIPIAIRNVTVIAMTDAPAMSGQTVVIQRGRIARIGPIKQISIPRSAIVVDGTGRYLIPGLWDMHIHAAQGREIYNRLFIANGITGVRDMGGYPQTLTAWRKEIASGKTLSPHLYSAGPIVDGFPPSWPFAIAAADGDKGHEAVAQVKQGGANFVKVYDLLPRDAYLGIVSEAKRRNIPVVGHIPYSITLSEASNAGQRSVEHLSGLWLACSTHETEIRRKIVALVKANPNYAVYGLQVNRLIEQKARTTFNAHRTTELFNTLVKNRTYQTPTAGVLRYYTLGGAGYSTDDPRIKYIPRVITDSWGNAQSTAPTYLVEQRKGRFREDLKMVGLMNRAGVPLLAGTDMGNPFIFPGFSLHDELAYFVEAGLTPLEALRTATRNPAEFFGISDRTGTIEKGKWADLILLEADPIADIANTKKIRAVIANGRLFTRTDLDCLLTEAEEEAAKYVPAIPPAVGFSRFDNHHKSRFNAH